MICHSRVLLQVSMGGDWLIARHQDGVGNDTRRVCPRSQVERPCVRLMRYIPGGGCVCLESIRMIESVHMYRIHTPMSACEKRVCSAPRSRRTLPSGAARWWPAAEDPVAVYSTACSRKNSRIGVLDGQMPGNAFSWGTRQWQGAEHYSLGALDRHIRAKT
jgi:hypothetical protein